MGSKRLHRSAAQVDSATYLPVREVERSEGGDGATTAERSAGERATHLPSGEVERSEGGVILGAERSDIPPPLGRSSEAREGETLGTERSDTPPFSREVEHQRGRVRSDQATHLPRGRSSAAREGERNHAHVMPRTAHLHQHLHLQLYTFVYPLVCVVCVFPFNF